MTCLSKDHDGAYGRHAAAVLPVIPAQPAIRWPEGEWQRLRCAGPWTPWINAPQGDEPSGHR
jgi:hypothetical protein